MTTQNENRDPLTGVWNRKYAFAQLERAVENCAQVALLFIDVDWMKHYLADFGLGEGDKQLTEIAREIEARSGKDSLVFRLGGDEFGLILYSASLGKARKMAESIRANRKSHSVMIWENGMTFDRKEVASLTLSIGIAHCPTHVLTAQNLIAAADIALLKAKRGGRLPDGTSYTGRNRVMAIGDFFDDFPEQTARFLK